MGKFDNTLDVKLASKVIGDDSSRITVSVCAYNDGEPKVQMTRERNLEDRGWVFQKLGRLSLSEAKEVTKAITSLVKEIEK